MHALLETLGGTTLLIAIVYFCSKKVAEMAISKALEDYKAELTFDAKKREKAALVAELLSEWVKEPMDKDKVHRLLWEASMWLPDAEAKDLNSLLTNSGKISTKQMIVKVRELIQGNASTLKADEIVHFD
jgi:hypothetical protein